MALNILYVGEEALNTTARHRADALRRLGHEVEIFDPTVVIPKHRLGRQLGHRTGYRLFAGAALRQMQNQAGDRTFDVAWVDSGYLISGASVRWLKTRAQRVVNYCVDDPTGPREPSRWSTFLRAIPEYDLLVVVRDPNRQEFLDRGAKDVLCVRRSFDEVAHARLPFSPEDEATWSSEVVFVGTWMPERGPFMASLIRAGVPLTLYGDRWQKAQEWPALKAHWRGAFASGRNYVKAIQYAKVSVGLLSKGNRDLHTQRSAEVPFIGTAFCAERTSEHLQMFADGIEAVLWSGPEECAAGCAALLNDSQRRQGMIECARAKVESLGLGNEAVCRKILVELAK